MKRRLSGVLGALFISGAAAAAPPPRTPVPIASADVFSHTATTAELAALTHATAESLKNAQVVRGRFVQRRHLAGLTRPLESSGTFLFARGVGIEWHTIEPFDSQFLLTDAGITQRDEGGAALRISAADQPALTVVSRVFFALFALDLEALAHDFELYGESADNAGWELGLKPRAKAMSSVFRAALVTGAATVSSVTLEDGNGDASEIELHDVVYDPKSLSAEERGRF